jgi:hypothetical protein
MFKDYIDRRNFIKLVGAGVAALALPSLAVSADPYRQMGFVDQNEIALPAIYDKRTLYFTKNPHDGWLTVLKFRNGWKPAPYARHFYPSLPDRRWVGYWTPQETGYVTQWSEYARSEAELIRLLQKRFGCQPYTLW